MPVTSLADQLGAERGASDSDVLTAATNMLVARTKRMGDALKRDFGDQVTESKHLDGGTSERAYWHSGYVAAMHDTLRMIKDRVGEYPMKMEGAGRSYE